MAQAFRIKTGYMIRIAITGPESTGKSWLAQQLADHYKTLWVAEYAREFLDKISRPYSYDDILEIAQKQFELENKFAEETNLLFCDTDFNVTNIWCTVKYNKCHDWITEKTQSNLYALYLLCDIDLPWQYDPFREHPDKRYEIFNMYESLLKKNRCQYHIISGTGETRLQNAIRVVDDFLYSN